MDVTDATGDFWFILYVMHNQLLDAAIFVLNADHFTVPSQEQIFPDLTCKLLMSIQDAAIGMNLLSLVAPPFPRLF
jgi:hypothetical protein